MYIRVAQKVKILNFLTQLCDVMQIDEKLSNFKFELNLIYFRGLALMIYTWHPYFFNDTYILLIKKPFSVTFDRKSFENY